MLLRKFPLTCALLATSLSVSAGHPVRADSPPTPTTAPAVEPPPAPENRDAPPPPPEGAPRRRGEGGPRGEGSGRGGPGGGSPGGGGPEMNMPPEERRQRVLAPYEEMVPDLTEVQKTHIMAIIEAANAESRAVRENTALSEARQRFVVRAVRGDIPNRVRSALTETQLAAYDARRAEQAEALAAMDKVGSIRPEETTEQMRERILKGYEAVLEELSVKQKTAIITILEDAAETTYEINADTKRTPAQKRVALQQTHDAVNAKVVPLLDNEQRAVWQKAHAAKRP